MYQGSIYVSPTTLLPVHLIFQNRSMYILYILYTLHPRVIYPPPLPRIGVDRDLTRSSCQELCASEEYPFYGLEWSIRCTCGGKETSKDKFIEGVAEFKLNEVTEACEMPCAGDETESCGGQEAFEIWET